MIRNSYEKKKQNKEIAAKGKPLVIVENCNRPSLGRTCVNSQRDICKQKKKKKKNYYEIVGSMILPEERAQTREKMQAAKPQIFGKKRDCS